MDTDAAMNIPVRSGSRFTEWVQCCNLICLVCFHGTLVGLVAFGICVVGLGIAKFVMGIIYLDECELQPLLPVYLIVEFCTTLMFFIVILVSVCKSKKSNTTDEFSISRLLVCLVSVLVPLFLFIWFIVGTVWVVNVREEINPPGHCNYTTTTSPIVTTSAWNFTANATTASTQNPVSLDNSLGSLSGATNPLEAATTSAAISHCSTCDETFVNFTFGVVIAQWAIVFATILGALFVFGWLFLFCSSIG